MYRTYLFQGWQGGFCSVHKIEAPLLRTVMSRNPKDGALWELQFPVRWSLGGCELYGFSGEGANTAKAGTSPEPRMGVNPRGSRLRLGNVLERGMRVQKYLTETDPQKSR